MERELHNEVLRDVTVGGTLGSGGQWAVRHMGIQEKHKLSVETPEGKTPVKRRGHASEDDIKMNL